MFRVRNFLVLCLLTAACLPFQSRVSRREKAEAFYAEKKYVEAISAYEEHIAERLAVKNRPEWENPYIYLLDIGDIYLDQGDVARALNYYQEAEQRDVEASYVNDRIRHVAAQMEKRGDLRGALDLLKKYRTRDPYLFDLMLDRIAREIVRLEDLES